MKEIIPSLEDTDLGTYYGKSLDKLSVDAVSEQSYIIPQAMKGIKLIHAIKLKRFQKVSIPFHLFSFFVFCKCLATYAIISSPGLHSSRCCTDSKD